MNREEYVRLVRLRTDLDQTESDLTTLVARLSNALEHPGNQTWMPVFEKLADARHALQDARNRYANALDLEAAKQ